MTNWLREHIADLRREAAMVRTLERVCSVRDVAVLLADSMLTWKFVALVLAIALIGHLLGYDLR